MAKTTLRNITTADLFSIHFIPTLIVFLVMMVLIGFSWRTASQAIVETQNEQVKVRSQFVESNIAQTFSNYDNALRSGAGLFNSSSDVSRDEWRSFVEAFDITNRLPALIGIGYGKLVSAAEKPAFEAMLQAEGFPNYAIRPPEPDRDQYLAITYIEPADARNLSVIAGDMFSEERRREAAQLARDTGTTTLTDVVSLLQTDGSRQNGITAYYPIYRKGAPIETEEQRRQAFTGVIYAPLRANDLFGKIFQDEDRNFNVQIYDGDELTDASLLYERYGDDEGEPYQYIEENKIEIANETWTIRYSARSGLVPESIRGRPRSVAFGGLVFSLLVAGLVYMLLQRRSRKIAEAENKKFEHAKDNMLSLASHQLRTPATGVKQYLGMVLEGFVGSISKEQKELLQRANDSNERQLRIINEFLYLAKADADRIIVSPQQFDIGQLVQNIITELRTDILEAGHTVRFKQRAKRVDAFADPHSARMIIENLISNAIKYTPAGGNITITVSKVRSTCLVSVADNGVGIARKDFAKLFKQFTRIPNELTRQESGSGIGLYLANYLAQLNNGTITVESKRHVGSTFSVKLPAKAVKKVTVS